MFKKITILMISFMMASQFNNVSYGAAAGDASSDVTAQAEYAIGTAVDLAQKLRNSEPPYNPALLDQLLLAVEKIEHYANIDPSIVDDPSIDQTLMKLVGGRGDIPSYLAQLRAHGPLSDAALDLGNAALNAKLKSIINKLEIIRVNAENALPRGAAAAR